MTNQDFQDELKAKVKAGVKPSQLKRSASTPVKSPNKEQTINEQAEVIKKLAQQKEVLLKVSQEAVSQNEQLALAIEKLKQEKSEWEEKYLAKRLELLKIPLTNTNSTEINQLTKKLFFYQRLNQTKNWLLINLLIVLVLVLLLK